MKLTIDTRPLAWMVNSAASFIPTRPVMQCQSYAKITARGTRVKMEATTQEAAIAYYANLLIAGDEGSFTIPIKEFKAFISRIKDSSVTIDAEDCAVTVIHSKGKATFPGISPDEFAKFGANDEDRSEAIIPAGMMKEIIRDCQGFLGTDDIRPHLMAIRIIIAPDGTLTAYATNMHALAEATFRVMPRGEQGEFYLMPSMFPVIAAIPDAENVTVGFNDKHVDFRTPSVIACSAVCKGKYPDCKRVMPATFRCISKTDRDALLDSMGRISQMCDDRCFMKMKFTCGSIALSSDSVDTGRQASESVAAAAEPSEDILIGVNVSYLANAVSLYPKGSDIRLNLSDASRPVLVDSETGNLKVVVMPMAIN